MEIRIDDRTIEANQGETVLQAALRHGIEIPHFCYHPCLSIAASCRICIVKVEGMPRLMPSCNLSVAANMKVETSTPDVQRARQMVMQFLMQNHPVDCGICDKAGECRLQDYQFAYGTQRSQSADPKHHKRKLHPLGTRIQLDNERCILCSRCVRFTAEVSKSNLLGVVERGGHSYIDTQDAVATPDAYSDNVIGLCPTGALLSTDFLYQSRVWFLEPVRSVCTGCARGCSVNLWRRKKEWQLRSLPEERNQMIYRVTACENPAVNGPWLCNKGFDLHQTAQRERALTAASGGTPATPAEALAAAKRLLAAASRPAALVSAQASNEELDAFSAALGGRLTVYTREDCRPEPGEIVEDALLIKADKNPNSHGVRARFGDVPFVAVAAAAAGHDLVLVWGDWADYAAFGAARVIHLTAHAAPGGPPADVLIPISTTFERDGSFCNFEGTQSAFAKVFDPPPGVLHAADVFAGLA
jgi:NADH-quinone oxidoreductase subunit G